MYVIIKDANLTNLNKTSSAVAQWISKNGTRKRITVEWLSGNGCVVYSKGECDKMVINV